MNIKLIKNEISSKIGKKIKVIYYGSRNRIDEIEGYIDGIYPKVFSFKYKNNEHIQTRSFAYSDVLSGTIKIFV